MAPDDDMVDVCPRCGSEDVRGSKSDLPDGGTLHERRCNGCRLLEARRDGERDLVKWLGTWLGVGSRKEPVGSPPPAPSPSPSRSPVSKPVWRAISAPKFLAGSHRAMTVERDRHLTLTEVRDHAAEVFASPELARLCSLNLERNELEDSDIALLASSHHVRGLRWLNLASNPALGLPALEHVAGSPNLRNLAYLGFGRNGIDDPKDEVQTDGDAIVFVGRTWTGRELERKFGHLSWLHWPEHFVNRAPTPDAFC